MTNPLKIKVCGMREKENIRDLLRLEPDMMGFIFYPGSPRCMPSHSTLIQEIERDLRTHPTLLTGVFVNATLDDVLAKTHAFQLAAAQLHGSESPSFCLQLRKQLAHDKPEEKVQLIKAFGISEDFDWEQLEDYATVVDYFLFDTRSSNHGGTGRQFDWTLLDKYGLNVPFILSGGIGEEDVDRLLEVAKNQPLLAGVDLNSRFETKPGWKDIKQLETTINLLRNGR